MIITLLHRSTIFPRLSSFRQIVGVSRVHRYPPIVRDFAERGSPTRECCHFLRACLAILGSWRTNGHENERGSISGGSTTTQRPASPTTR